MPRTPDPVEDDLRSLPPPPVFHVEQALLGALLLEPHRAAGLTGITAEAFSSAGHAALFTAIRSLPAPDPAQHAKNTKWLNQVLTAAGEQTRGLTTAYLHHLVQLCPQPQHAPAYARIIEAEHARRLLRTAAQRLVQTALDTSLPHRVAATLAEAGALTTVVDDIANRFPPHPGSPPRTPAAPVAVLDEEAAGEEQVLLAAATARPARVERMRWLTPGDFTHPLHAGLWRCLTTMARRGTPIDPVTVRWEAQHHGLLTNEGQPAGLLGFLGEPAGCEPEYWGERILQRSLLTTAQHTGRSIETLTHDPAATTYQLVVGARRALAGLNAVRARWHHATTPASANRPARTRAETAPAVPRAGPPPTTAPPAVRTPR
ncbi:DnaB-like helicase N-terminal domain-containing protein [Streptomyces sp. IB2014 016-6]|uniref:DnaB-like helicase N-terminal domain-containing protein n=1 Tax=Streptomyces sp. IB2014 016-6 TaxID=2517818 RepID=UPI0011C89FB5|nr:DnaB-like helicase N-terminal domain-containing protein [Streptomyces sp. IB2014 016-6]TXL84166.1 replicative DNA helicase [Streptomyces sp. IB2014 016-6]